MQTSSKLLVKKLSFGMTEKKVDKKQNHNGTKRPKGFKLRKGQKEFTSGIDSESELHTPKSRLQTSSVDYRLKILDSGLQVQTLDI